MSNIPRPVYPKIQVQASQKSKFYQKLSRALILASLCVLVLAAGLDTFKLGWLGNYYPKTVLLLLSLVLAALAKKLALEKKWYASRSLSETIKTLVWRFIMRAAPFDERPSPELSLLWDRIERACYESNALIGSTQFWLDRQDPILSGLNDDQALLVEKVSCYVNGRIKAQLNWYERKAQHNELMSRVYFFLLMICTAGAVSCSALQEASGDSQVPLTGLLIAISTAIIGWVEARKYSELSAAYSLTRNEIRLLLSDMHHISSHSELAVFVTEAESLFSREHTQWAAKRGYMNFG